jgi:hypothetical protein
MISWIRNNKWRLLLSVASLWLAGLYVLKWRAPHDISSTSEFVKIAGLRWLEAGLIVSLIMSAATFFISFFILLFKDTKPKLTTGQKCGVMLGLFLYLVLLVIFLIQCTLNWLELDGLLRILLVIAFVIAVVDTLLKLPGWAIELDFIFFVALSLTYLVIKINWIPIYGETSFIIGFHSGAAAFQLILVNLIFDPILYIDVFKTE